MNAIIIYVPVIHQGYLDFLNRHKNVDYIYLIDESCISEMSKKEERKYLSRDFLSSIGSHKIGRALDTFGYNFCEGASHRYQRVRHITQELLERKDYIKNHFGVFEKIILPNEDVSQYFAEDYFVPLGFGEKVYMDDTAFLRWNKNIPQKEQIVPNSVTTIIPLFLTDVVRTAYKEAEKSSDVWRHIGGVLFDEQECEIIFTAFNKHFPEHSPFMYGDARAHLSPGEIPEWVTSIHGEQSIFAQCLNKGVSVKGLSLYTTTYPCPVCAKQIALSGIKKVYYTEGYSVMEQAGSVMKQYGVEIIHIPKEVL